MLDQTRKVWPGEILLANSKMSDKLQFVVAFGSGRMAETSDKLKFVGHSRRHFSLLPSLPAVSGAMTNLKSQMTNGK